MVFDGACGEVDVWDGVVVVPWRGIIRVGAVGAVRHRTAGILFLSGGIGEGFAAGVLGVPDLRGGLGGGVVADHIVFPIADVVVDGLGEVGPAIIEGVEVEVEGVEGSILVVYGYDCAGGGVVCFAR